jgi:hypothetical protein
VEFGNSKNYLTARAHMSAARFCLTTQDGHLVPRATPIPSGRAHRMESSRCWWPPVVAAHVSWPLLSTAPDVIQGSHHPFRFPFPRLAARLAALLRVGCCFTHCCSSPMSRPELSNRAKRRPHPCAHPTPRACLQCRQAKPGHGISLPSSSSTSASVAHS